MIPCELAHGPSCSRRRPEPARVQGRATRLDQRDGGVRIIATVVSTGRRASASRVKTALGDQARRADAWPMPTVGIARCTTGFELVQRGRTGFKRARRRFGWLDHVVRAGIRYDQADGGRLAAAVTYYAFFAAFALALLGFAILGHVLDNGTVLRSVQVYLSQNLPRLDAQALRDARGTAGLVALVVLPVAGLFWVDALRSSIRAVWRLPEYPGNFFLRQLIDLAVLAGLGLVLSVSLAVAVGAENLLSWLLVVTGADGPSGRWLLGPAGFALGFGVNTLMYIAILTGLPRLRMRLGRVLGPALLVVSAGLELLKTVGRLYVQRTESNPAYQIVAGAVGLLVFLNLLNQLILFASALQRDQHEWTRHRPGRPSDTRRTTRPPQQPARTVTLTGSSAAARSVIQRCGPRPPAPPPAVDAECGSPPSRMCHRR